MLTTSKKSQFSYVRRLMVLPLIASLVCLFAFTVKTRNLVYSPEKIMTVKPFVLVVDAGHGGKDGGAFGNDIYEKDIALKIAQKIKSLSSPYGIDVILTRTSDVFMSPVEKSNFANAQKADVFISIHANARFDKPAQSGFEVMLSPDNEKFASQNQVLGSAILQNISKDFNAASSLQIRSTGIWILKNSNIPSALVECGFITNKTDADNLKDDAKIELMAKNILQGVAMYANNSFDRSKLYQLENAAIQDTNAPVKANIADARPLYFLNGKEISEEEMKKLEPTTIESVTVLKDKNATDKYGNKGQNGVVEIISKSNSATLNQPLYVLNEKVIQKSEVDKLDPNIITEINVLKDKQATDKYGEKGKNGVVEITAKKG